MDIITITKSDQKIILVLGVVMLSVGLILLSTAIVKYPDIEKSMILSVEPENITMIPLSNIEYTTDLKGYFEVEDGSIDFIITSREWQHTWGLIIYGFFHEITGIYKIENVSEDHFNVNLNKPDDILSYSDEWYLVFENSNSTDVRIIELHYSLHPWMRDTLIVSATVFFIGSLCFFIVVSALFLRDRVSENKIHHNEKKPLQN